MFSVRLRSGPVGNLSVCFLQTNNCDFDSPASSSLISPEHYSDTSTRDKLEFLSCGEQCFRVSVCFCGHLVLKTFVSSFQSSSNPQRTHGVPQGSAPSPLFSIRLLPHGQKKILKLHVFIFDLQLSESK